MAKNDTKNVTHPAQKNASKASGHADARKSAGKAVNKAELAASKQVGEDPSAAQKKDFLARFKKATKGKDLTHVAREINNNFEQYRTAELIARVHKMAAGKVIDEKILTAIEAIED
jgi:Ni/Co efflux regulator RcnB